MKDDSGFKLSDAEIARALDNCADEFPPILTLAQAAKLLQVPLGTIRYWRSCGRLGSCSRKVGAHVRVYRDLLVKQAFNHGI
jgi:excisionase family DNA binding protein